LASRSAYPDRQRVDARLVGNLRCPGRESTRSPTDSSVHPERVTSACRRPGCTIDADQPRQPTVEGGSVTTCVKVAAAGPIPHRTCIHCEICCSIGFTFAVSGSSKGSVNSRSEPADTACRDRLTVWAGDSALIRTSWGYPVHPGLAYPGGDYGRDGC